MWTMWDAPSDRDYYEQFGPPVDCDDEEDNMIASQPDAELLVAIAMVSMDESECPF